MEPLPRGDPEGSKPPGASGHSLSSKKTDREALYLEELWGAGIKLQRGA